MKIEDNMLWPPIASILQWQHREHSAWYSGSPEIIANFYSEYASDNVFNLSKQLANRETFWGRQIENQGEISVHVPIAGDIAETSANLLFSESPTIKIVEAYEEKTRQSFKDTQSRLDLMLMESGFYRKILEGAETASAMGGVYIKLAWDRELSEYPIPVIEQVDRAIPEFKFGILSAVTFWRIIKAEKDIKIYRLLERYDKGVITYNLYVGTQERLGKRIELASISETEDLEDQVEFGIDAVLAVYIPNVLPNRLDRNSCLGRSDYSGIEGLMDSLDEVFTCWSKDIVLAQGRIMIPEEFLKSRGKNRHFNIDKMLYVKLDMDPITMGKGNSITAQQFEIRATEFEKTSLNLIERIVTSAGYSPQSFGLGIDGRAESGTALKLRERKSFITKAKKENYWGASLKHLVHLMILLYNAELGGREEVDVNVNVAFGDSISEDVSQMSNAIKMLSDAFAISTETKVRMIHPDWEEEQIATETKKIIEENQLSPLENPDELGKKFIDEE